MSTKSLAWNLLGGLPKKAAETTARRPVPHARPITRGTARTQPWSRQQTRIYFGLLLGLATILMLVAYIFGINRSAAKGYEITKQKNQLNALVEDNKKLIVRAAEIGSILQIQDQLASEHLVQITNQEYLQVNQLSQR